MFVRAFNRGMRAALRTIRDVSPSPRRTVAEPRPDRRQAILLAAEKLFAQRGYHAVTIRQIAQEAGVPLALVGYYYGQKHELFHAIFAHWNRTIEERLAALREVALDAPPDEALRLIIEAFTGPVLRLRASAEGEYYALLVARELSHALDETDRVLRAYFDPMAHAFIDALHERLPHASRGEVAWCYQFALGALLHHLSDDRVVRLSKGECALRDAAGARLLVEFIVGGIRTALPPPTSRTAGTASRPAARRRRPS
jgi:AcrR family transcriptional regulator